MNHRRFLVTVSMLDVCKGDSERTELDCFNLRKREWHACPHPTPDIIQNRLDTGIMLRLSMDRDEVLNTSRINWAFHDCNLGLVL